MEGDELVICGTCGESFVDGSEEAELIGWHGVCAKCELKGGWRVRGLIALSLAFVFGTVMFMAGLNVWAGA